MSYGVTFWGSSDIKTVFNNQNKIIRIVAGVKRCREVFKKCYIFHLATDFLLSLLLFVVANMKNFQILTYIIRTENKHVLHMLNANLTHYQKGAYYARKKLFTLPSSIKV
jgi:hypothetical protein